jgi:hypothetical protein
MNAIEHEAKMAEIRQGQFDAQTELRRKLLSGDSTEIDRANIVKFGRRLKAEVARFHIDAETERDLRRAGLRDMTVQLSADTRAEIDRRLAPLALPAPPAPIEEY